MNQDELQNTVLCGDALEMLKRLPDEYVQMCVTSPPYYGLRDYGAEGQIGCEQTPLEYIDRLTEIFREVRRVLKSNGTLWLNIADSYAGSGKGVWSKSLGSEYESTVLMRPALRRMWTTSCRAIRRERCLQTPSSSLCSIRRPPTALSWQSS